MINVPASAGMTILFLLRLRSEPALNVVEGTASTFHVLSVDNMLSLTSIQNRESSIELSLTEIFFKST